MVKIILYRDIPLTNRDFRRFGVDVLRSRGFEVDILDVTSLVHPDYFTGWSPLDLSDDSRIIRMKDRRQVEEYLAANKQAIGIAAMQLSANNSFFYRLLKYLDICYLQAGLSNRPWPTLHTRLTNFRSIQQKLTKSYVTAYAKFMAQKVVADYFKYYQPPHYVLRGGRKDIPSRPFPTTSSEEIWAHAYDYDLYLQTTHKPSSETDGKPLAVFLDEYLPFHPDFRDIPETEQQIDGKVYFEMLNRVFDQVENDLHCRVVIAGHPRARYAEGPENPFWPRPVELGKTNELVSKASIVIAHASTAINLAVAHKKPIIFLTSHAIENGWYGPHVTAIAGELGKRPIHMEDRHADFTSEFKIDENKYHRYHENYIKVDGTPEKPLWEIVADHLIK